MSDNQDFETENLDETVDTETDTESTETPDPVTERLDRMESLLQSFAAGNNKQIKDEAKQQGITLTVDQIAALKDNPEMLIKFVEEKTTNAVNQMTRKVDMDKWDTKAEKDFPALKTDKVFQGKVTEKIKELIAYGDIPKDSPRLLYLAAEMAAAKYQTKQSPSADSRKPDTSALRPGQKRPNTQPSDKRQQELEQKTYLLKAAGYSKEKIEKMLKNYEASTHEYETRSGLRKRFTQL